MNLREKIKSMNDRLAVLVTISVSTMACVYAFIFISALPLFFPAWQPQILYFSNCLQLVFLPIILVGQALLGKSSEDRAISDHKKLIKEFHLVKNDDSKLDAILKKLEELEGKVATLTSGTE